MVAHERVPAFLGRTLETGLFHAFGHPTVSPMSITIGVTNKCNSRCATCGIWRHSSEPAIKEFTLEEYYLTFKSIRHHPFWLTMTGGEPFLRDDLAEICLLAASQLKPGVITLPTNGSLPRIIAERMKCMLEAIDDTVLMVNLSLDGVGDKHDRIRGVPGSYERLIATYNLLFELTRVYPNFHLGIHTVISRFNINDLSEVCNLVRSLRPDTHIFEIAEERSELFNLGWNMTPGPHQYADTTMRLHSILENPSGRKSFTARIIQACRLAYYQITSRELLEGRQVIPCYAGYASCQITPLGEVWPCCVHGYNMVVGSLRDADYNFEAIWSSEKASQVRRFIKDGKCSCPLANAHYTSMLFDIPTLTNILGQVMLRSL
jgi:MoaA/NifB/PqqE/SkfB family radical SAM enzyme